MAAHDLARALADLEEIRGHVGVELPDVPHDLWHTHPAVWQGLVASAALG